MSTFDAQVWKNRAWARFERAIKKIPARDKRALADANHRWFTEVNAIDDMKAVITWCESRKLEVKFVKQSFGTYIHDNKTIELSSRLSPTKQLIILLHECGHHLIGGAEKHVRFGMGYPQADSEINRTFQHRASILDEEMEAWHRGWKLATRLNLRVNREDFDKTRLPCIKSYVQWALKPGNSLKEDGDKS